MEARTFLDNFGTIAQAPGGIDQLRQLVLNLAVRGRLVEQEPGEEGAEPLLSRMQALRDGLVDAGVINRPRHPSGVPVSDPPCELPDGWAWSRLGDISAIVGGGTPKSTEPSFWSDEPAVPWLTPADMRCQESRYASSGSRDISELGLKKSSAQLLPKGSVLFSSRAPIGHVAIASRPLATNQGFKSSVQYEPEMSEYIYVFLRKVGPEIDENATGTTFKEVNAKEVSLIPVPIPPLEEQHRIVAKVDELMTLCDQLETQQQTRTQTATKLQASALNALTTAETADDLQTAWERVHTIWETLSTDVQGVDRLRQLILGLSVRGRLVEQSPEETDGSVAVELAIAEMAKLVEGGEIRRPKPIERIDDADLPFGLPDNWCWSRLGGLAAIINGDRGKNYPSGSALVDEGVPFVNAAHLSGQFVELSEMNYITEERCAILRSGKFLERDLLYCLRGSLGKMAIVQEGLRGAIASSLIIIRAPGGVVPEYLYLVLAGPLGAQMISRYDNGTAQPNLAAGSVAKYLVPVPPLSEQQRIVAKVDELMGLCDELEARLVERDRVGEALAASVVDAFAA